MTNFQTAIEAINNGKHVTRKTWGKGSNMFADKNGQLMRVGPNGNTYGWSLDMRDINAVDWTIV